jgi:hemerythrin
MSKIQYTPALATGIKEIDDQHKRFISLCAAIVESAEKSESKEIEKEKIDALDKYAYVHFHTEHAFMAQYKYPDAEGHKKLHAHFMEELKAIRSRAIHGETGKEFAGEIKEKIAHWFILHIQKNDKKMLGFIKDVM